MKTDEVPLIYRTTLWVTLVTIGVSIIAFCLPVATSLAAEARKEESYHYALSMEIQHNSLEAQNVLNQFNRDKTITLMPTYTTTAYEAIVNAGLLNIYNNEKPGYLINLYAHIAQWSIVSDAIRTLDNTGARDSTLASHAKMTISYVDDFNNNLSLNKATTGESSFYYLGSVIGGVFLGIGIVVAFISESAHRIGTARNSKLQKVRKRNG